MIYENLELLPQDLQGWNGTSIIFNNLIEELKPTNIVEVGSWKGLSSITMGNCVKRLNLNTKIYCIDTWLGATEFITYMKDTPDRNLMYKNGYPQIYYQFLSNVVHNNLQDVIQPIPNTSNIGFQYLKHNNIIPQLIYVDGSHDYDDVYLDIRNYYSILENGGIIFGDDYVESWPGVKGAVNKFTFENNLEFSVFENNFWVIKK